jgi:cellulose biosynthesis protein BcsQ
MSAKALEIAVVNGKGGTGKTTCSCLLGLALEQMGYRPVFKDIDPQHTLTKWLNEFGRSDLLNPPDKPSSKTVVINDTPPRLEILANTLAQVDRIILVCRPGPGDLHASQDTVSQRIAGKGLSHKARILFNSVEEGTRVAKFLDPTASEIKLARLPGYIRKRACISTLAFGGWDGLTKETKEEVQQVARMILEYQITQPRIQI